MQTENYVKKSTFKVLLMTILRFNKREQNEPKSKKCIYLFLLSNNINHRTFNIFYSILHIHIHILI